VNVGVHSNGCNDSANCCKDFVVHFFVYDWVLGIPRNEGPQRSAFCMSERGLARLFLSLSLSLSGSLPCPLPFAFSSLLTLPSQSDDTVPFLHLSPCLIRIGYVSVVLQPSFHTPTARWFQRRLFFVVQDIVLVISKVWQAVYMCRKQPSHTHAVLKSRSMLQWKSFQHRFYAVVAKQSRFAWFELLQRFNYVIRDACTSPHYSAGVVSTI